MEKKVAHFFVDEAGDLTFFDQKGRIIVGEPGVSHTFMLGLAEIAEPGPLAAQLDQLRQELLSDPYFAGVPSMLSTAGKTALAFHAKDDVPEVRREVFTLLARTDLKERLHLAERNHIIFARRGKADRNIVMSDAIRRAKRDFDARWRKGIDRPTTVSSSVPSESSCLQAIDYCLWALQRMVERREERYFALLRDKLRLVLDRDDDRRHGYGEYYTSRNSLTLERLMPVT